MNRISCETVSPNDFASLSDDSAMIQAAVDHAAIKGGTVAIPRINARTGESVWILTRAIELPDDCTVLLLDCVLRLADGVYCNIFKNVNARTPLGCTPEGTQRNICIQGIGRAVLDGGNHNGLTQKTQKKDGLPGVIENTSIHFHNVEHVTVDNIAICNQRWWGMTFHFCSDGRLTNIHFTAHNNAPNQDGIDLRAGCNNFLIENITGCTGDDTIALTCLDHGLNSALTVPGLDDSIHSVIIRNISTYVTGRHAMVRLLNHDGRKLHSIIVENILDRSYGTPFRANAAVRIGENAYFEEGRRARPGDTHSITVQNVTTRARFGVFIGCTLQDAVISNIVMNHDGGNGVFFSNCDADNIHISNIRYSVTGSCDDTSFEGKHIARYDALYAVGLWQSVVRRTSVSGVTAGNSLKAVIGGYGNAKIKLDGVTLLSENTKITHGEGIEAESASVGG